MADILYFVIPCYNEEEVLPETSKRLKEQLGHLVSKGLAHPDSRIVFVNDGSKDRTWELIEQLHAQDAVFSGVNLSRNRGHQNALLAGLMTVKDAADLTISMDADLQDDIAACEEMLEKYYDGADIVYGVRSRRQTDTFFKKFTADGQTIGIGQINSMSEEELAEVREKILPEIEEVRRAEGLDMVFVLLTNILKEESEVVFAGKAAGSIIENGFSVVSRNGCALLAGVVSRKKQFLPTIVDTMES